MFQNLAELGDTSIPIGIFNVHPTYKVLTALHSFWGLQSFSSWGISGPQLGIKPTTSGLIDGIGEIKNEMFPVFILKGGNHNLS